jgi:hypothetical protein
MVVKNVSTASHLQSNALLRDISFPEIAWHLTQWLAFESQKVASPGVREFQHIASNKIEAKYQFSELL